MDSKHFALNDLKKRKYGLDGKIEGGGREGAPTLSFVTLIIKA